MKSLELAFRDASPRHNRPATPIGSWLIHLAALAFWIILFSRIFAGDGLVAWSVGLAYIGYDTALLLFVASAWPSLWRDAPPTAGPGPRRTVGVIIAAHNEAGSLAATIDALLAQTDPPDQIWLADDGSSDDSPARLRARYGLEPPEIGRRGAPSPIAPALRWLRLPHGGKARALNAALAFVDTDVVLTVDADTLLEPPAIAAVRSAFAADPDLVVGGGVLTPHCDASPMGRCLQEFQTYEYVRNFLARLAWSRLDCLLLISGAFAAFRRDAVLAVGGFDADCLVEDYELMHRIHRWAIDRGLTWRVRMLSGAKARTDAPGRPAALFEAAAALVRGLFADAILEPRHDRQSALRRAGARDDACEVARTRCNRFSA